MPSFTGPSSSFAAGSLFVIAILGTGSRTKHEAPGAESYSRTHHTLPFSIGLSISRAGLVDAPDGVIVSVPCWAVDDWAETQVAPRWMILRGVELAVMSASRQKGSEAISGTGWGAAVRRGCLRLATRLW